MSLENASETPQVKRLVEEFSRLPGIGPKTAKRIVVEIKEKITTDSSSKRALDTSKINFYKKKFKME